MKGGIINMTFLEKIDYLCEKNKLNKRQFSIKSGIPYSTIDNMYKRGYEGIRLSTVVLICDYFGITMDSLARDEQGIVYVADLLENDMSVYDTKLLNEYHRLTPEGKERVDYTLRAELELSNANDEEKKDVQVG